MRILIRDAEILDSTSKHHLERKNILIENGVITFIGSRIPKADKVIKGKDLKASKGWFDMFAWFGDPGFEVKEDLESGTNAAAHGGFTGVALLPNTKPVIQTKNDIFYLLSGNPGRITEVFAVASVTENNLGEDLTEMIDLHTAGAVAFSDGLKPIWLTDIMLRSLQYLKKFDGLLINKPEDLRLNMFGVMHEGKTSTGLGMKGMPRLAEEVMIARDLQLLAYTGGKIHLANISTPNALNMIRKARKNGLRVTCDVAAHQFVLDDTRLHDFDTHYKVNPPLREQADIQALIAGLKDGTIDAIVSSHQPQDEECKKLEFDYASFGMTGLQTVLPYMQGISEIIGWDTLIEKVTSNPRKILNLEDIPVQKGNKANITIFDPEDTWLFDEKTNMSKSGNSPLLGKELKGKVVAVFNNKKHLIIG